MRQWQAVGLACLILFVVGCQAGAPPVQAVSDAPASAAAGPIVIDGQAVLGPLPVVRGVMTEWMYTPRANPKTAEPRGVDKSYGRIFSLQEPDFALAAEIGINTIRLSISHESIEVRDQPGQWYEGGFARIQQLLDWCAKYDLMAILDLHNALGREGGGDPRLWREPQYQDRFVAVWQEIARRFKDNPQVIAYEPLNEPEPQHVRDMAERHAVWNSLAQRTSRAIREIDPDRPIIINSIEYAHPSAFKGLELSGVPNTVYSFHWYDPKPFHMQKRPTLQDKQTYHYPDVIYGRAWNRRTILESWQPALQFAREHDVPLFCGEFGCVSDCPEMEDMVWLLDVISLFDQNAIGWTYYHYMFRTVEPYWREHFDCNLFIFDTVNDKLYTFDRKVSLLSDLMKLRGEALRHDQPAEEDLSLYAVRLATGELRVYAWNKSREQIKEMALRLAGGPWGGQASVQRMAVGTGGFVPADAATVTDGQLNLTLEPLTILRLSVRPENVFATQAP